MPARVVLQDFTGVPASSISPRCAPRWSAWAATRRRSTRSSRATSSSTTACRSTRSAGRRAREERRDRVRAQRRTLPVPQVGPEGVPELPCRAAGDRHRPPGQSRVPRRRVVDERGRRAHGRDPDSCVGTDSHTTMINGLGVVGWGVGGIEAEAVMLGQPIYMLTPEVVGFKLTGQLPRGRHRDRPRPHRHPDAAQERRRRQVRRVLRPRPRRHVRSPDRATIANMAPEYGATMGFFPVDDETLATCGAPAATSDRSTSSSGTTRSRGSSAPPRRPSRRSPTRRARPRHDRAVAWPVRSVRRTASRSAT